MSVKAYKRLKSWNRSAHWLSHFGVWKPQMDLATRGSIYRSREEAGLKEVSVIHDNVIYL